MRYKVWAVDYRTSKDTALGAASWASLRRLDRCHGQPGSVFSAHEVLDGTEPNRCSLMPPLYCATGERVDFAVLEVGYHYAGTA